MLSTLSQPTLSTPALGASRLALWGKSVAVRLPAALIRESGWTAGLPMQFERRADGAVILKPAPQKLDLDALLAQVTDDNLPDEADIEWGAARGKEVW